ncbi:MAG: hypothetical protein K8L99_06290 [Anaerolineae bacterium]|nr:hypothetical protein [Anaerolineae bacterium]
MAADKTVHARPMPDRPPYGFLAWQATIGYIASEYSPDALLTVAVAPRAEVILWQAIASWGQFAESVSDKPSLAAALAGLWREVDRHHNLIHTMEASAKRPVKYADNQWLDDDTQKALDRILSSMSIVFGSDWRLTIIYQPIQNPDMRVQVRLVAQNDKVKAGGRGATLMDACRSLYRNAASSLQSPV